MLALHAFFFPRAEVSIYLWSIDTTINDNARGFDHPSTELCLVIIITMIHHVQPALNKLLVVGGNGFIGLPFLQSRVPE